MKEPKLKSKKATAIFAIIALIAGTIFLSGNTITGNVVLTDRYSLNLISLIGLSLIACAIILGAYSIKSK